MPPLFTPSLVAACASDYLVSVCTNFHAQPSTTTTTQLVNTNPPLKPHFSPPGTMLFYWAMPQYRDPIPLEHIINNTINKLHTFAEHIFSNTSLLVLSALLPPLIWYALYKRGSRQNANPKDNIATGQQHLHLLAEARRKLAERKLERESGSGSQDPSTPVVKGKKSLAKRVDTPRPDFGRLDGFPSYF